MFTYVKAKNFKSLKCIEFNLKRTQKNTNDFVAIYGENGSGKTNIVEMFKFLQQMIIARGFDVLWNKLPQDFLDIKDKMQDKLPMEIQPMWSLTLNLEEYRTINEKEDTEIEYGFKIDGKEGFYYIRFNKDIVEEKLYFFVNKQNGYYFNISKNGNNIQKEFNHNIFLNENYNKELEETIEKYWGKYSFLSLLTFEFRDKNQKFLFDSISRKVYKVIAVLLSTSVHVEKWISTLIPDYFIKMIELPDLREGIISKVKIDEIKKYEDVLNIFFTQAYADIKSVEYHMEENEEKIRYKLFFNKIIGGDLKAIPIDLESEGTKRIVEQFETLIGAITGRTVVIDEIDNGIHDLLMKNIIMSIKEEITGQLIITTHNTLLLEILPKECIYILSTDYEGNKRINTIKEYGMKIQKNHNARDLYLKGVFGGIPTTTYVDFEEIKYVLEDSKDKKDKNNNEETELL